MKFTAVGDIIISRRIQETFEGYQELASIINQGDVKFFNLETTLNNEGECYASEASGGTWLRTNPEVLDDVKKFGFNMTSFNNNHVMDFSFEGLLATLDSVEQSGIIHAGVGRNLAEASAPRYLETEKGRVALISVNTTLMGQMIAGAQTDRMKGRPGVNPLRVKQHVELGKEEFKALQNIIKKTGINAQRELEKREGYHGGVNNNVETIGGINFVCGETTRRVRRCDERDLERVKKAIYEASLQADYIMISLHSHDMGMAEKEEPADFVEEFAHFCIDNGAHAVVGHGPHLLRPIEIYKGCPIFYSLGDFVLQLYNIEYAPEDFYDEVLGGLECRCVRRARSVGTGTCRGLFFVCAARRVDAPRPFVQKNAWGIGARRYDTAEGHVTLFGRCAWRGQSGRRCGSDHVRRCRRCFLDVGQCRLGHAAQIRRDGVGAAPSAPRA